MNYSNFFLDNLINIYYITRQFPHFQILQKHIKMIVEKYPSQIFDSHYFFELPEDILLSCLENDDLNFYEIDIWNRVLKWGIEQMPRKLNKRKMEDWMIEDFLELEEKLKNCIQLIRFHHIQSKDFYKDVIPFQPIIPDTIFNDIVKFHLTNEVLVIPFCNVRRPNLHESDASIDNQVSLLLRFLESDKYLGYFWSRFCEKKLHVYIKFLLFLFINIFYLSIAIFAILIIMWSSIIFAMHASIRKFIDYMTIEDRSFSI
ncbi:hypothetical protein C1645_327983 [Glomus cerebriforme]|uniref:BACK domain-containing protein n=1 Tax=Glomus cerebriforme TaxID=658196 RepID=A0A397SUX5_9GLOM|nr:hypothetical protein C1645_327983 [Glomus cerebriforme]